MDKKRQLLLLKAKRRQIIWQIEDGAKRLERKRQKLAALNETIGRLDSRFDASRTPSPHLRRRPEMEPLGSILRRITLVMRRAGAPMLSADIARAVPLPKGCKTTHGKRIWAIMAYLKKSGRVSRRGHGRKTKWSLVSSSKGYCREAA